MNCRKLANGVMERGSRPEPVEIRAVSLVIRALRGRMAAESYILLRPDLCQHSGSHPNGESTNETHTYNWPYARRRVLCGAGERRGAHGDIEEHQGDRRD